MVAGIILVSGAGIIGITEIVQAAEIQASYKSVIGGVCLATGAALYHVASSFTPQNIWEVAVGADDTGWNCWKAVLHDTSPEASNGMPLPEFISHLNIAEVKYLEGGNVVVKNKWHEEFNVDLVLVDGNLAVHATRL